MICVHIVGDGARDAATVPHLVANILGIEIESKPHNWKDIHLRSVTGYSKRLRFFMRQAIDKNADGLVAVVDRDKSEARSRLRELQEARDDHRKANPRFPTALGEAAPHGEAWLLADQTAIREVLGLGGDETIPNVRHENNPKAVLDSLISRYRTDAARISEILTEIARLVDHRRCLHGDRTGFTYLVEDVNREFGHFVEKRPSE
jgi:hypothetical protein